jgi:hypothetical protein
MDVRYFFLRYFVQLLLIIVAVFGAGVLFGIFYVLACCTRLAPREQLKFGCASLVSSCAMMQ